MNLLTTVKKRDLRRLAIYGKPLRVGPATMASRMICAYSLCNPNCKISFGQVKRLSSEQREPLTLSVPEGAIEYLKQKANLLSLPFEIVTAIILQKAISHIASDPRFHILLNGAK